MKETNNNNFCEMDANGVHFGTQTHTRDYSCLIYITNEMIILVNQCPIYTWVS